MGQKNAKLRHELREVRGVEFNAEADRRLNVLQKNAKEGTADVPFGDDVACAVCRCDAETEVLRGLAGDLGAAATRAIEL